ncbi:MAG: glycosyltransferase family 2 protein [Methanoregulaceae archaeon]|jgi:glycosyltransferase involved in cell wall biosynthesis
MKKNNGNGSGSGNGDASDSIISLINHYSAFSETIAANSAVAGYRDAPLALPERERPPSRHPTEIGSISQIHPRKPLVVAVIPAYNEELSIGTVVVHARQYVDAVIVVDDGSADATSLIATAAGADVITFPGNRGKAAALLEGFARARELDPDAVVMLDSDGQHNPAEIPALVKPVLDGQADLVIGSRFLINGNNIPRYRQLGQKTLDIATAMSSGFATTDSQSGFRAVGRKGLANLTFASEGYNIESDMITHFLQNGLLITEVPITVKYDVPNRHKKHPLSHGLDILSHIIGVVGYRRPLISFGIPGFILALIGIGVSLFTLSKYVTGGPLHTVMFVGGITSLILGLLMVTTGLILNSLVQIVKVGKRAD